MTSTLKSTNLNLNKTASRAQTAPSKTVTINEDKHTRISHGLVASILIQQQGKSKVKQLKGNHNYEAFVHHSEIIQEMKESIAKNSREHKQSAFLAEISRSQEFEKSKEVKFFNCKGSPGITDEEIREVLQERELWARQEAEKDDYSVDETTGVTKRIIRPANITAEEAVIAATGGSQNTEIVPNNSSMRFFMLAIFKANVMKVIARMRAQRRLQKIRRFIHHYNYSKEAISVVIDGYEGTSSVSSRESVQNRNSSLLSFNVHEGSIRHAGFPTFEKAKTSFSEVPTHPFVKYESFPELPLRFSEENKQYSFFDVSPGTNSGAINNHPIPALRRGNDDFKL